MNITNHYFFLSLGNILNLTGGILNNTLGTALHLVSQNPGTDQRFDYFVQGNLTSPTGGEYYQVQSPPSPSNSPENMAAIVWALDVNGLQSRLHVFDANQKPVAVQVLANGSGTYTIQLPNVPGNASYYIEVTAENPNSTSHSTGRFSLGVDFHVPILVSFGPLASGSLTQAQSQAAGTLTTAEDELFHFALSGFSSNPNALVTMTIVDQTGATVLTLTVQAGQPTVTADIFLKQGTYSVRFSGTTTDGSTLTDIDFQLAGDVISDPVGAYSTPPSSSGTTTSSPPLYSYQPANSGANQPPPATTPPYTPPYYY
jgi:hypothetical protein